LSERFDNAQHATLALLSLWLIGSSPWIALYRRVPQGAGWLDHAHVVLGFAALLLAVSYAWSCSRQGRWRLYFPWTPRSFGGVASDLGGLLRGRIPAAEGGGLFGLIEGLLLVALLLTAASGAGWYFAQGTGGVLEWREFHACAAHGLVVLIVLHVVTVAAHLVEFVRD